MTSCQRATAVLTIAIPLLSSVALHAQGATSALDPGRSAETQELIGVLQSDATTFDKSQACQRLAAIGNEEAVPVLAALLADCATQRGAALALGRLRAEQPAQLRPVPRGAWVYRPL